MSMTASLQIRIHDRNSRLPTLIYLPGLHGDWTLVTPFRRAVAGKVRFVEFTYPHRPWLLPDYAEAIERALRENGVTQGWLLGESFGSQVAWALLSHLEGRHHHQDQPAFEPLGLILAGGFVRYPLPWGVKLVQFGNRTIRKNVVKASVEGYARIFKARHHHDPVIDASLDEFVANRLQPDDQRTIVQRYDLILSHEPRPLAARTLLPVHYLTGFLDIIVPWPFVQPWLKRHIPGYRGWRMFLKSDHNVLGAQPVKAAEQILEWMRLTSTMAKDQTQHHHGVRLSVGVEHERGNG